MSGSYLNICVSLAVLFSAVAPGEEPGPESPPRDPAAGLKSIHVPEGFVVELMASEPLVLDPVAFDWDTRGRLWVVEMADYPLGLDGKNKAGGRVRVLEDRDRDGRYDHATLFAEGLNFPTGVLTWRDGAIVTAAPDILFLRDTTRDGVCNEREVLLTGLSQGNQQLRANGLRWGLDNWVYVAAGGHHGNYPRDTKLRSSRNQTEVAVGSRDFRFRPDTGEVEAQSGPTQFGRNRDDWGRWFGTQNARPLWHYVLPDHYLRRNPHYAAPEGRVQLPGPIQPPVYPVSSQQKRYHGFDHAGHYTSACSGMIYRDVHLFGSGKMHGFACEPFHNVVQRIDLQPQGVTFSGKRGGKDGSPDFFASTDRWCRPVMVRTGPDGALWVADMYRYMIEHPDWLPKNGKKELLPFYRHGDDRGRIYRVRRKGEEPPAMLDLERMDLAELVHRLGSPNGWVRDKAQQLLLWRGARNQTRGLASLAVEAEAPLMRLHALCTLDGLGTLTPEVVVKALSDAHPGVRENALRLAESRATAEVVAAALKLAGDPEPRVRMQLAFSLGAFPAHARAGRTLAEILLRDHADPYIRAAAFCSALTHDAALIEALVSSEHPALDGLRRPMIEIHLGTGRTDFLAALLAPVFRKASASFSKETVEPCVEVLDLLVRRKKPLPKLLESLGATKGGLGELAEAYSRLSEHAHRQLSGEAGPVSSRIVAAALLSRVEGRRPEAIKFLAGRLKPCADLEELAQVFKALSGTGDATVPALVIQAWSGFSPEARALALDELLSRTEWTRELLEAMGGEVVRPADFDAIRRLRLLNHPDKALRATAAKRLQSDSSPARSKVVEDYRPALKLKGEAARGQAVYRRACIACHRHGKEGLEVGPDLRTVAEHPPEKLLVSILDPNLEIQPGYHAYNCELKSGEKLFGLLAAENAASITLKFPDATMRDILRTDLASLKSVNLSLMPEGLEAVVTPQDLSDLVAFLRLKP